MRDEIVEEVRRLREEYAAEFNYDLEARPCKGLVSDGTLYALVGHHGERYEPWYYELVVIDLTNFMEENTARTGGGAG